MDNIKKILSLSDSEVLKHIDELDNYYYEQLSKRVNRSCGSAIRLMLLELKNFTEMTNFKFIGERVQYKNRKDSRETISNMNMTNEKAIEFLKTNPDRIKLFSEYPANWKELIKNNETSDENYTIDKKYELDALAEAQGVDFTEKDLLKMKLVNLRKLYPNIKAKSVKEFVSKVQSLKTETE